MNKRPLVLAAFAVCFASFSGAQEWGPSYIPEVPKAMGSAVQEVCILVKDISWKPTEPKVGQDIQVAAELFLDEELTDGRIEKGVLHVSYPDGTQTAEPLRPAGGHWIGTVPGAPCPGLLSFRLDVGDTMGNKTVQLPVEEAPWPPTDSDFFPVLTDWPGEEVVCPWVDFTSLEMALTEEDLLLRLASAGGIRVADRRWFLYGVAADRRDYAEKDQGDELGSATFLIYIPFLFKALLIDPEKLFDLSVTEFLAGPGDGDTLFLEDKLMVRISRDRFESQGDAPFKLIVLSLALDSSEGFELSALSGGDASPYLLVYPGVQTVQIAE